MENVEIERKFLVKDVSVVKDVPGTAIRQGYMTEKGATVRVRVAGDKGYLTIKGKTSGLARPEFEYEIPFEHAVQMLAMFCKDRIIEKTRHIISFEGNDFEVDVFVGRHNGLVMAEVEMDSEDQVVALPDWIGEEVSMDKRYSNKSLALEGCVPA